MKITCNCGELIVDHADNMPTKAHVIPDQEWQGMYDTLEAKIVDALVDGRIDRDTAYMSIQTVIGSMSRLMWQCCSCGRLYIDDRQGKLQCYVPDTAETEREILRSDS